MLFHRQKSHADGIRPRVGQSESQLLAFASEKLMGNLD
jgi:hypothetical protein